MSCVFVQDTFVRAKSWVKELQRQASPNIVIALSGNKADLASKRMVDFEVCSVYCYLLPLSVCATYVSVHISNTHVHTHSRRLKSMLRRTVYCLWRLLQKQL